MAAVHGLPARRRVGQCRASIRSAFYLGRTAPCLRRGSSRPRERAKSTSAICGSAWKERDMNTELPKVQNSILLRLENLLGEDVFFVPCEWGTKKPLVTYVERPFEATKTEAYRALFAVQEVNVAVYLGKASGGL